MKNLKILIMASVLINILLLLLIYQGSVEIVSLQQWINPTVIATLIGGVGGALLGTLVSGYNASKQWNIQMENQKKENEKNYNMLMKQLLGVITAKNSSDKIEMYNVYPNLILVESPLGEEEYGYRENDKDEINKFFQKVEGDIWSVFEEMELLYQQSDELARSGKVDWATYRLINSLRFYKPYIKEYHEKLSLVESANKNIEELVEYANYRRNTEDYEWAKEVLKAHDDLVSLRELFICYVRSTISIKQSISKKV